MLHEAGAPKSKRFLRFAVLVSVMLGGLIDRRRGCRWLCGRGGWAVDTWWLRVPRKIEVDGRVGRGGRIS